MDTTNKLAEERARFEAQFKGYLGQWKDGSYINAFANEGWKTWLAAKSDAAQATQAVSEPVATQPAEAVAKKIDEILDGYIHVYQTNQEHTFQGSSVYWDIHTNIRRDLKAAFANPAPASASEAADHRCRNDVSVCKRSACEKECQYAHLAPASVAGAGEALELELPGDIESSIQLVIAAACNWGPTDGETRNRTADLRAKITAALARQAPAPLSQAVPAGLWLAPMEPDQAMLDAHGQCDFAEGKQWLDEDAKSSWSAMRDSWLSRQPQPQAVTEDARDGELS